VEVIVQSEIQQQSVAQYILIRQVVPLFVLIVKLVIIVLIIKVLKNVLLECILSLVPQLVHYVQLVIFVQDLQS